MKRKVFYPLVVILSLVFLASLSLLGYTIYLNNGGTTIKIFNSENETKENIKVSSFYLTPGNSYQDDIFLVSSEKNTFDVTLKYNLEHDGGMIKYTDLTIKVGEKEVLTKTSIEDAFINPITFNMDLSLIKNSFSLIYSMDESVGNEAYQTSMSFNIDVIIKRSF